MKYKIGFIFLFLTGFFLQNCKFESPDIDTKTASAFVDGRVLDSNDEPLSDVSIEITSHQTSCQEEGKTHGVVDTDNEGRFLQVISRSDEVTANCLTLRTSSKINRELKDSTITRSADLEFKFSEPYDNETVNISY